MDPMIDFVRERTADLQRTAESVHQERDLRHSTAPLGVAVVVGRLDRPTPVPASAPVAASSAPAPAAACPPCSTDGARQAA